MLPFQMGRIRELFFLQGSIDVNTRVFRPSIIYSTAWLDDGVNRGEDWDMQHVRGLHHVTAIAGPAQENLDFYAGVLGMRLVKKSVNQDDPATYHLFYADAEGHPGSDLTFFPWAEMAPPRPGYG